MKTDSKNKLNLTTIFCFANCLIVFIFFAHTLGYSWKHFDENIIFQETILPIPKSLSEIFEIISLFGVNLHFIASNPFYSNISNLRSNPINSFILLFIFWLFKKSAFAYHMFSLSLHLLNCCLCFLSINKTSLAITNADSKTLNNYRLCIVSLLTLVFALHPANIESILFASNFGALITYCFCLLIFYYLINLNHQVELLPYHSILLFLLYLFPLFLNEYSVTLPLILFSYLSATSLFYNPTTNYKNTILLTFKKILPLLLALIVFAINFFSLPVVKISQETNLTITLERILWLSPQIFFHFIKLILFPLHLSIDQTALVKLSKTLFEPYSILCCVFTYTFLILLLISFFLIKKRGFFLFFISFFSFFLALLPFLHIISPIYNLTSERYLYFPMFFLVLGSSHFLFNYISQKNSIHKNIILTVLAFVLCTSSIRSYLRTLDWKDSFTLLTSTIKTAPNNLFKGLRQEMLATSIKTFETSISQNKSKNYSQKALVSLKKAFLEFKKMEKEHQHKTPEIIKFYGLDPKTLAAKTVFLIAFCDHDLNNDDARAYKIFSPYINDLRVVDSQILNFYYKILFNLKKINEAENLLVKSLKQNQISSTLFVALSDLYEYKYNDLKQTQQYLNLSFKYFPYDPFTLFGLKRLYRMLGNVEQFAFYSYLYGLRTRDLLSLKEAAYAYTLINKKEKSKCILRKIFKHYPLDQETLIIKTRFEETFGKLEP